MSRISAGSLAMVFIGSDQSRNVWEHSPLRRRPHRSDGQAIDRLSNCLFRRPLKSHGTSNLYLARSTQTGGFYGMAGRCRHSDRANGSAPTIPKIIAASTGG
jgi:hypothetical protein